MEKGIIKFVKLIDKFSRMVNLLSAWGLFLLMAIGIVSIVLRIAGYGLQGAINLSVYVLVAIVYLAFAYSQSQKQHIAVEIVVSKLKGKPKKVLAVVAVILAFAATSFMLWTTFSFGWESWVIREKMDGYPYYPVYPAKIAVVIGIFVLWLQVIADFFKTLLDDGERAEN